MPYLQADAWKVIASLLQSGAIKPIVAKTFPLAKAADALRYLVEGRPFGRHHLHRHDDRKNQRNTREHVRGSN